MKTKEKGASSAIVILIILILGIIIGAYYWKKNPSTPTTTTTTPSGYGNTQTTGNTNETVLTPLNNTNNTNGSPAVVTPSTTVTGGSNYQFPTGLTLALPATWQAYSITHTSPSFGGVTPADSTTFNVGGAKALTINTFTKEQWNRIRTQENAANQNVNSLGEGTYLGENSTYIYSYTINGRDAESSQIVKSVVKY